MSQGQDGPVGAQLLDARDARDANMKCCMVSWQAIVTAAICRALGLEQLCSYSHMHLGRVGETLNLIVTAASQAKASCEGGDEVEAAMVCCRRETQSRESQDGLSTGPTIR
jgi:hypothetical protein